MVPQSPGTSQAPGSLTENTQAEADSINAKTDRATASRHKGNEPGTATAAASSSSGPVRTKTTKKKLTKPRKIRRQVQKQSRQEESEDDSSSSGPSVAY